MAVNVQPSEVWEFFQQNRKELSEKYLLVASSDDGQVEIYITEENGMPFFTVDVNGECESEADCVSKVNAENNYRELIGLFLEDEAGSEIFQPDDLDRLDEINCAADDFIRVLIECSPEYACLEERDLDDIVSIVEQHLYDVYGISVRHPTIVENENGDAQVIQYPYGEDE